MTNYLFKTALNSRDSDAQADAVTDIGNLFFGTRDVDAIQTLCLVALCRDTLPDIRWLAYVFALEVAGHASSSLPVKTPSNGFQIPKDFDDEFFSAWGVRGRNRRKASPGSDSGFGVQ